MKCPNCGAPVRSNQKFCDYCGTELPEKETHERVIINNYYNNAQEQYGGREGRSSRTQTSRRVYENGSFRRAGARDSYYEPAPDYSAAYTINSRPESAKSWKTTFILCVLLGIIGGHRFYVGKIGTGVLYLFTGGLCGIGFLYDLIQIIREKFTDKYGCEVRFTRRTEAPNDKKWIWVAVCVGLLFFWLAN